MVNSKFLYYYIERSKSGRCFVVCNRGGVRIQAPFVTAFTFVKHINSVLYRYYTRSKGVSK